MTRTPAMVLGFMLFGASASFATHALEAARYVTAEEITGVVVEADTGKPISNAIVAIRFERNNTGHSGPHCFRSMAVQANAEGRFRFAPWTQENTRADGTYGEVTAYKAGYAVPWRGVYVTQSRRSILGIAFSDTIRIPNTDVRLELKLFVGSDEARMQELRRVAGNFTCRMQAYFDDMVLLTSIRDEIASSPIANEGGGSGHYSNIQWINAVIKASTDPRMPNVRTGTHEKK